MKRSSKWQLVVLLTLSFFQAPFALSHDGWVGNIANHRGKNQAATITLLQGNHSNVSCLPVGSTMTSVVYFESHLPAA